MCLSFICYLCIYIIYIYFFLIFFWIELSRIFVTKDQIQIDTYVMNEILLIYRFLSIFPPNLLSLSSSSFSFIIIIIIIFFFLFSSSLFFFFTMKRKHFVPQIEISEIKISNSEKDKSSCACSLFNHLHCLLLDQLDYWPTIYYLSDCFVLELLSTGYVKVWSSSFLRLRHGERQFRGIQIFSLLLFILFTATFWDSRETSATKLYLFFLSLKIIVGFRKNERQKKDKNRSHVG